MQINYLCKKNYHNSLCFRMSVKCICLLNIRVRVQLDCTAFHNFRFKDLLVPVICGWCIIYKVRFSICDEYPFASACRPFTRLKQICFVKSSQHESKLQINDMANLWSLKYITWTLAEEMVQLNSRWGHIFGVCRYNDARADNFVQWSLAQI